MKKQNIDVKKIQYFNKYFRQKILLIAKTEWLYWYKKAESISNLNSGKFIKKCLKTKILHSLGASIYATTLPISKAKKVAQYCTRLQILADLLDSESEREKINSRLVRQIHCLMIDFVKNGILIKNHYPPQEKLLLNVNYIQHLVQKGKGINSLSSYSTIKPFLLNSIKRYALAQVYSSMPAWRRDKENKKWARQAQAKKLGFKWFEYYASQASTLPLFALIALAAQENIDRKMVNLIHRAHYSWFSTLHIMFNHLQGLKEDIKHGAINYIFYYGNKAQIKKRIIEIVKKAKMDFYQLPNATFYLFVLLNLIKRYVGYQIR